MYKATRKNKKNEFTKQNKYKIAHTVANIIPNVKIDNRQKLTLCRYN